MNRSNIFLALVCTTLLWSCASVSAPTGTVPLRRNLATDAFGGWLTASFKTGRQPARGEFIALSPDSLYVMERDTVKTFSLSNVERARVIVFNTNVSGYTIWTVLASLATISNGAFAVITLPLTATTGAVITSQEANRIHYFDFPQTPWDELSKFARFPQGLPPTVNKADLKPRPQLTQK